VQKIICERCGYVWYQQRAREIYCQSCRAKPAKTIRDGFITPCLPWHGPFDELDRPINGNALLYPGVRMCRNSDCVEPTHIVGAER
jgi:hypothetical protein